MAKGTKRDSNGQTTPQVGGSKIDKFKVKEKVIEMVTMIHGGQGNLNENNKCKPKSDSQNRRVMRAKRKIDFKSFAKTGEKTLGVNNNAQKCDKSRTRARSKGKGQDKAVNSKDAVEVRQKNKLSESSDIVEPNNKKRIKLTDGIQVMVNSDEELDYKDDIDIPLGDEGSIDGDTEDLTDSAIILGATSDTLNDEELVMSNLHLKKLFNKMLDERIKKAAAEHGETSDSRILSSLTPPQGAAKRSNKGNQNQVLQPTTRLIKSPSDTTVYAPALNRMQGTPFVEQVLALPVMNMVNSQERINSIDKHDNCKVMVQIHAGILESNNMQDQIDQVVRGTYPQNVDSIKKYNNG